MVSGLLGADFEGEARVPASFDDEFVHEVSVAQRPKSPRYKVGIKPVEDGLVIDHISSGAPIEDIWGHLDAIRRMLKLNVRGGPRGLPQQPGHLQGHHLASRT